MKKIVLALCTLLALSACQSNKETTDTNDDEHYINLNGDSAILDGEIIKESDYTWHVDPSVSHDEIKDAPAEYYSGTKLDEDVYIDHDLKYYPDLGIENYKLINYDGEEEYAYYYNDGINDEYIFATLPKLNEDVLKTMVHSEEEASNNKVLHINKAGTYILEGTWNGQINIDIKDDEKVKLILNGVDISCTVAPAILFENAYECALEYGETFNTDDSGVTVSLNEETVNNITGNNIYRMLKNVYKNENSKVQKKIRKYDAAFYSKVSMNIEGKGILNINSNFEGLDSEMHLTIKDGNITINSVDDGINVNEDDISVVSFLGGTVNINHIIGSEGDGVDSNGYVIIDGGKLNINGIVMPDNAIDSDQIIDYRSGNITIDGETITLDAGTYKNISSNKDRRGMDFEDKKPTMNQDFDFKAFKEAINGLDDNATIDDIMALLGMNGFKEKEGPFELGKKA